MQTKIKIFFVFLAIGAVFSVMSFFDVFRGVRSALLSDSVSISAVQEDSDNDGLTDTDESYWDTNFMNPDTDGDGFLDGEEVASGHDPAVPGPDDALMKKNLTDQLTSLAIAGLVEGSLKPGSPEYEKSLDDVALSIVDDSILKLNPEVDLSKMLIIPSSEENSKIYIKQVQPVIREFLSTISTQLVELSANQTPMFLTDDNSSPDTSFLKVSDIFGNIYEQALRIQIPENWKDAHFSLLVSLGRLTETNKAIAYRAKDPIKAAAAFSLWAESYENNISDLIKKYSDEMVKQGLSQDFK